MKAGYKYERLECPVCKRDIGSNWLVRHLKEVHPEPEIDDEYPLACYSCKESHPMACQGCVHNEDATKG